MTYDEYIRLITEYKALEIQNNIQYEQARYDHWKLPPLFPTPEAIGIRNKIRAYEVEHNLEHAI